MIFFQVPPSIVQWSRIVAQGQDIVLRCISVLIFLINNAIDLLINRSLLVHWYCTPIQYVCEFSRELGSNPNQRFHVHSGVLFFLVSTYYSLGIWKCFCERYPMWNSFRIYNPKSFVVQLVATKTTSGTFCVKKYIEYESQLRLLDQRDISSILSPAMIFFKHLFPLFNGPGIVAPGQDIILQWH